MIEVVSNLGLCRASRWSTIAPKTTNLVLDAFIEGANQVRGNRDHTLSFQVSLHSTDHDERVRHTGVERLLGMSEIAEASAEITRITGRRLSLAFVLHAGSVIEPEVLAEKFSPAHNVISLRPVWTADSYNCWPMSAETTLALYADLRNYGWDVIYMPPNLAESGDEGPIELHNMVPGFLALNR